MNVNGKDSANKLANVNNGQQPTLKQWVAKMADQIKCALPANITPERMTRIALTALSKDAKLSQSTPDSFIGALLTSAQLGLECNTPLGQAYLIPFWNGKKQCLETQFQLGYQGLLDLCYRTGQYRTIQARIVYEGDDFDYSYGLEEKLVHRPKGMTEKPIYVYAYYELINGAKAYEVMSWDAVQNHAKKYSQSVQKGYSSPWSTDPESMAKKTLLKKVLKYAPKTVEIAEGIAGDSAIIKANTINDSGNVSIVKEFDYSAETKENATIPEMVNNSAQEEVREVQRPVEKAPETMNKANNNGNNFVPDSMANVPVDEASINAAFDQMRPLEFDDADIF